MAMNQILSNNITFVRIYLLKLHTHRHAHPHIPAHQHRLPNWPSKSGGEWNKDVLLWAWRSAPRAWPSAAGRAQQEDGEMRSAQLLKPASCRQTRHHAGTGSSHERQSTKIAKYCYDCIVCVCVLLSLGAEEFKLEWVTLSPLCYWCYLSSVIPRLIQNVWQLLKIYGQSYASA